MRTRAIGSEAPLRAALGQEERLLVCATVRFSDRNSSQPLWLTDRRFLFTRKEKRVKYLVSVPVAAAPLAFQPGEYPLQLHWTDEAGRPRIDAFRALSWKDRLGNGTAAASGGASGGIAGALVGLVIDAGVGALAHHRESPSRDQALYTTLTAALHTPADVRPIDMTSGSFSTLAGRLWIAMPIALFSIALLAAATWALDSYVLKQAYEQAAPCSAKPAPNCRVLTPAVVTNVRGEPGKYAYCDLWLQPATGSGIRADLHNYGLCGTQPLGRTMQIESFRGALTGVIPSGPGPATPDQEASDNPEYDWRTAEIVAMVCAGLWLLFSSSSIVSIVGWLRRRSLLQQSARQGGYLL